MASVSELTGKTIGGYRLDRLIGEGSMGPVYYGVHRDNGHKAAVKVIPSRLLASRSLLERFVNDQKLLARQHHPGLVEIFDAGKIADLGVYLVMEFLGGNPLSELLQAAQGGMLVQRALRITEGICAALEASHEVGVLHRNLKPSNVFVVTQGKRVFVKLIDFGVNALPPGPGQHDYRAPEQAQSFPINEGADIYSVGVMLFEMLTDKKVSHLDDPAPAPSQFRDGISTALDGLVGELLARFPESRPGSAKRVREACAQLRADLPSESGILPVVSAPPTAVMRASAPRAAPVPIADDAPPTMLMRASAPRSPAPEADEPVTDAGVLVSRPPLVEMDEPLQAATRPSRPVAAAVEVEPADAPTVIPSALLEAPPQPRRSGPHSQPSPAPSPAVPKPSPRPEARPSRPKADAVAVEKATPSKSLDSVDRPKRATGELPAVPKPEVSPWPKRIAAWTLGPVALAVAVWFWNKPIQRYGAQQQQQQQAEQVDEVKTVKPAKAGVAPFDPGAPLDEDELGAPDNVKGPRSTVSADKPVLKKRNKK